MTQPPASSPMSSLKRCLTLAQNIETQAEAKQMFEPLYEKMLEENPQAAEIMELLWQGDSPHNNSKKPSSNS